MSGTLYVVATPIGNLDDLSPRAREVLEKVDLVVAEDTRHTGRLLSHIGAKTPQTALHDFNESDAVERLIAKLNDGADLALVSDAGTPLISDPGYRLVRAARAAALPVTPLPGPSAVTAALSVSGLATDRFSFEGFLPSKAAARQRALTELRRQPHTMVFFESVHRIAESIADMAEILGASREAFVAREVSKLHEQCEYGTLGELKAKVDDGEIVRKGEFVLVVAGSPAQDESAELAERLLAELAPLLPAKTVASVVSKLTGERRNAIYQQLISKQA